MPGFSFSSRLIVLVEAPRVEKVVSEVDLSSKVSSSKKIVLLLLAVEAGGVKKDSRFLPSRRILSCAIITACAIKISHQGGCCQGE